MCVINKIGPPVEGSNFYGREKEIRSANRLLNMGHSLLLSAPRRIGKSSLAKRLIEEKRREGWKCVYIDLEQITTEEGFLKTIIETFDQGGIWKQLADGVSSGLKSLLDRIQKVSIAGVGVELASKESHEDLYKKLNDLIRHDEDALIVIDELTLFLSVLLSQEGGRDKVASILNWFRGLRQESQTHVRWLFCGSVGLKNFTSSQNLSYTINDLTDFALDELPREEAKGLLRELCKGDRIVLDEELIDYILDKLVWNIPYFIQIVFSKIADADSPVTREMIDQAYVELSSGSYLNTWEERLKEYREFELPARQVLKSLAMNKSGMERVALRDLLMTGQNPSRIDDVDLMLSKVLQMLENDGYLIKKNSVRAFRSPILRDYWYGRFVQ